jgi:nitroimidazol reductase NimA-like FMN-containing flavoprotein (pyridoxamine 5'-phosphate oxidase superfamily)
MANRRSQIQLSDDEVEAFLADHWSLVLGSQGPHGAPHLVTMSYGLLEGAIVVAAFRSSQKSVNVRRDPRVSMLIEENQSHYAMTRGVLASGVATVDDDIDAVRRASQAVVAQRRQVLGEDVFIPDSVELSAAKRCVISLVPTRIASWDHSRLAGAY